MILNIDKKLKVSIALPGEEEDDEASRGGEKHAEEESALQRSFQLFGENEMINISQ